MRALEEAFAARVGKAAALFVPSGVMANQLALRVLTKPGSAVVAGRRQHVVAYEYGAAALNAGVQFVEVDDGDGTIDPADVSRARAAAGTPPARGGAGQYREHAHGGVGRTVVVDRLRAVVEAAGPVPSTWTGPVSSTPRWRRARPPPSGRRRPRPSWAASPRACARRSARCWRGHRRHGRGPPGPQAPRGRHAPGRRAGGAGPGRARATWSSGCTRTTPGRRRLAEAVAERWPACGLDPDAVRTNIVTFAHAEPDEAPGAPGGAGRAGRTPSRRRSSASSRTTTSTTPASRRAVAALGEAP